MRRRGVYALFAAAVGLALVLGAFVVVPETVQQVTEPQEVVLGGGDAAATASDVSDVNRGHVAANEERPAQPASETPVGDESTGMFADVETELRPRSRKLVDPEVANGTVLVTRGDEPVAGVRVRIYTWRRVGGRALADLRTGTDGIAHLPPALVPMPHPVVVLLEAPDGLRQQETMGTAWMNAHFDLTDDEGSPLRRLTVRVVDLEGAPVRGARVRALVGALVTAEGRTGEDGVVHLRCAAKAVEVSDAIGRVARVVERGDARMAPWSPTVVLRPGRSGAVSGSVVDAEGRAIDGAIVRATWPGGDASAEAATDEQGAFRLECLPEGRVSLEVWTDASDAGDVPVATGAALVETDRDARVTLRVLGPAGLEVQVVDHGRPVQGARVVLTDPAVTRFGDFVASGAQGQATTGSDGCARLSAPAGRWRVRTHAPADPDRIAIADAIVEAGAVARVVLDLDRQRKLAVRVVDLEGRPVQGVFMDVSMPGLQWSRMPSARTGGDGVARFEQLPPGLAELHLGLADQWRMLHTSEEEAEFVWTQPVEVRLRVVLEDGARPLRVVTVLPDVAKLTDEDVVHVVAHPQGALLEAEVVTPGGAQEVWVVPADSDRAPLSLGVVDGPRWELVDWRARFPRAASVSGRLVDDRGAGVAGTVTVDGPLGGALAARAQWLTGTANDEWVTINEWSVGTGPDGLFEVGGLPPGRVTLLLHGVGCAPGRVDVDVPEGGRVELGGVMQRSQ